MKSKQRITAHPAGRPRAAGLLIAALAIACRSAPVVAPPPDAMVLNAGLPPIDVRYGLDINEIELGILLAVAEPPNPPALQAGVTITDDILETILGGRTDAPDAENPWYFEGRSPGLVFAGYQRGDVRMQVAIMYDEQMVLLRIETSQNLGQTETHILSRAFTLLKELDERIRRGVIAIAQRNRYGIPVPASR